MGSTSVQSVAEEYFNSLNPIALRISVDVLSTKCAYEHVWDTLSYAEQRQVIDETIIHPEAVLKYAFERSLEKPNISPTLNFQSDGKFILEDDCNKTIQWKDEHSGPFSWLTQSQLNLSQVTSPFKVTRRLPPFRSNANEGFVDDPQLVLGGSAGSTAKLAAVIGSKLKLTPPGARNLETATKSEKAAPDSPSTGLLSKLRNKTAILRIPASLKGVTSPKSDSSSRGKSDKSDKENLVQKRNTINVAPAKKIKDPAPKPPVSKPKGPPPPPPTQPPKPPPEEDKNSVDVERVALLGKSWSSELSAAQSSTLKSTAESLALATDSTSEMELCSSTLLSPYEMSPRQTEPDFMQIVESGSIPKTGFEFLDNW